MLSKKTLNEFYPDYRKNCYFPADITELIVSYLCQIRREIYPNGQLIYEVPYVNNKKHGLMREWWDTGILRHEVPYVNGRKHGIEKNFRLSGGILTEIIHKNGVQQYSRCYDRGVLHSESFYKDGIRVRDKLWWKTGQLYKETTYKNQQKHGVQRTWYIDGKLYRETHYKDGEKHGTDRTWYKNGQLYREKYYENGVEQYREGVIEWYENGTPIREQYDTVYKTYFKDGIMLLDQVGKSQETWRLENGEYKFYKKNDRSIAVGYEQSICPRPSFNYGISI